MLCSVLVGVLNVVLIRVLSDDRALEVICVDLVPCGPGLDRAVGDPARESAARHLVLVRAHDADALWGRLLTAGEPLGAASVGYDALTLLHASSIPGG